MAAVALDKAADEAIIACGEVIKGMIPINSYLKDELAKISYGYARGRIDRRERRIACACRACRRREMRASNPKSVG